MDRRIIVHEEAVKMFCPVTSGGFLNNCRGHTCMLWAQAYTVSPEAVVENMINRDSLHISLREEDGAFKALPTQEHKPERIPVEGYGYCGAYK